MNNIDKECVELINAINSIKGLETVESCCGHGDRKFRIWFIVRDLKNMPVLLYYTVPCHVGFKWNCYVQTDCAMSPVTFCLESIEKGKIAYEQANKIAYEINKFFDESF